MLAAAKYPATVLVLDFECFFDAKYSLTELDTATYIMDKRFEVLGAAVKMGDNPAVWMRYENLACYFHDTLDWATVTVTMHNANFDASVLALRYGIFPPYVIDTINLSRFANARRSHALKNLCKDYGLVDKGDTMEFSGASFRTRYTPGKKRKGVAGPPVPVPPMGVDMHQKLADYAVNDAERQWELFAKLLPVLDNPETELPLMQHTLEMFTKPCLAFDDQRAYDIQCAMHEEKLAAIPADVEESDLCGPGSEAKFENLLSTRLVEAGDFPPAYMKVSEKTGESSFALAQDDPEREKLLNHANERVSRLVKARVAVKTWPTHIAKLESMRDMARSCGGLLPIPLKYHGAHTGRWSGDEGINPQNMGSKSHPLINATRETLQAGEGYKLVICDAAAVEARGLAWVAGQDDLVSKFAQGAEIYCGFAELVLGRPVRKPKKLGSPGYIESVEKRMTWARNSIGKIGILGCGYGMGTTRIHGMGEGEIDEALAEKIKVKYRESNKQIVKFWGDCERAFLHVAKYGQPTRLGRWLAFDRTDYANVRIRLPNGRHLHYPMVRVEKGKFDSDTLRIFNGKEHKWEHAWGGTIVENIVQGFCRDLLAEAVLRLHRLGWKIPLHCHDEVVILCKQEFAESALHDAIVEISRTPAWAPGLPLGAEGKIVDFYQK